MSFILVNFMVMLLEVGVEGFYVPEISPKTTGGGKE